MSLTPEKAAHALFAELLDLLRPAEIEMVGKNKHLAGDNVSKSESFDVGARQLRWGRTHRLLPNRAGRFGPVNVPEHPRAL